MTFSPRFGANLKIVFKKSVALDNMSESISALHKALDNQVTFLCMLNIYLMGETRDLHRMREILGKWGKF